MKNSCLGRDAVYIGRNSPTVRTNGQPTSFWENMYAVGSCEAVVNFYQIVRCHVPNYYFIYFKHLG
jgi:hypothetical protein